MILCVVVIRDLMILNVFLLGFVNIGEFVLLRMI